ncbi:MAG: IS1634 family transposase [Clostridia bacterium]|nr:IS1634 family transposase [Clostridia bacterium]
MRLKYNKTSKGNCYYVIRSVYKNGKNTSETYERLGYPEEIREKYNCDDPQQWMEDYVAKLNEKEELERKIKILVPYCQTELIEKGQAQSCNIGYLFLQQIYYQLRLDLICNRISKEYNFQYDLNEILSRLVYGRILYPSSKLSTYRQSQDLLETASFEYHQIVRALSVFAKEFYPIQAELYKNSSEVIARKTGVLYYDCTNFFFEIEAEDNISNEEADRRDIAARKYGYSKQHQPSPVVEMGMFMDYSGIPLAICLNRGNQNEQPTLVPLEKKILEDFELSKFVVCTDSGLSSADNKMYNNFGERSFITTVSIKKMKKEDADWCLDPTGWKLDKDDRKTYDIRELEKTEEERTRNYDKVFYKERFIRDYDEKRDISFEYSRIITYSLKYRDYLVAKRNGQIDRAVKAIASGEKSIETKNAQDYRRFIRKTARDNKGVKVRINYELNENAIAEEARFDGFYAVETNLLDDVSAVLSVSRGRWEIEESFRIMKSDFHSRPVYLSRNDRIKAHFLTCFISLLVIRILEKKLGGKYTCGTILDTLRGMRMTKAKDIGHIPSYTRTDITDSLHEMAGFRTDYEITKAKAMKGIIRKTKQRTHEIIKC